MFCTNCGNQIPDDAKFCTACGAKISAPAIAEESAPVTVEETAPVTIEEAAPVTVEEAAPAAVEETEPVTVEETAPVTVEETAPVTVEEAAPATVEETEPVTVEETAPVTIEEAVPAAVEEAAPAAVEETAPAAVEETEPAAVEETEPVTVEEAAPVMVEENAPVIEKAPKKKGKKGLIIGLCADGVLVGAAAVGYFCFHSDITHLFMGDAGYAKMIEEKAYTGRFDKMNMTTAEMYLGESFDALLMSKPGENVNIEETDPEELIQTIKEKADINVKEILDKYLSMIVPEGKGVSAENSVDVKLNNVLTAMISAFAGNRNADEANGLMNGIKYGSKVINGNTDVIGFNLADDKGVIGGIDVYFDSDGKVVFTLPEITDKVLYADLGGSSAESAPEKAKLSDDEIDRILKKVARIYIDSYDKAEITFAKDVSYSYGNAGVKGTEVSAKFNAETVTYMINELGSFLANDEYLCNYACENYGFTAESYKAIFSEAKTQDMKGDIVISNLVDVHNNYLGKSITVHSGGEENETVVVKMFGDDKCSALTLTYDNNNDSGLGLAVITENESEGTGKSNIKAIAKDGTLSVDVIYNDVKPEKFLDKDVVTGSVTIKLADDDEMMKKLIDSIGTVDTSDRQTSMLTSAELVPEEDGSNNPMSAVQSMIISELAKIECSVNAKLENGVYEYGFNVVVGNLGSIGYSSKLTEIDAGVVSAPDTANAINIGNLDGENAEAVLNDLSKDVLQWLKKLCERVPVVKSVLGDQIDELIADMEKDELFRKHYADYNGGTEELASDTAGSLFENYNNAVYETLVTNGSNYTKGTIKLYFDNEGNVTVLDDAGMDVINYVMPWNIDGCRNAYAEMYFDTRKSNDLLGITVVMTDNAQDIPNGLPTEFNFIDNVYSWEDKVGYIGEYVVGTCPVLYTGEVYTTDEMLGEFKPAGGASSDTVPVDLVVLDEAAFICGGIAEESPVIIMSNALDVSLILESNMYGRWSVVGSFENGSYAETEKVFYAASVEELINKLNDNYNTIVELRDHENGFIAELVYNRGSLKGVNVLSKLINKTAVEGVYPTASEYEAGSFTNSASNPIGTYNPATKGALKSEMPVSPAGLNGVWAIDKIYGLEEDGEDELIEMLSDVTFEIYDGYIIVNAFYESQQYGLVYSDDGITIVDDDKEELFNLYYDAENESVTIFESAYSEDAVTLKKVGELDTNKPEIYTAPADTSAIAGVWIIPENEMTLDEGIAGYEIVVTENGMMLPGGMGSINVDDIYYLIPDGDKYRMCIDQSGRCLTAPEYYDDGTAWYDEANDVFMMETGGIQAVFERVSYAEKDCKFIGDWILSVFDGLSVEEYAEINDIDVSDIMTVIKLSSFGMIAESKYSCNYSVINVINPREFSIYEETEEQTVSESYIYNESYIYDDATDTLKCTIKFSVVSPDEPQSIELVFKRGTYTLSE